MSECYCTFLDAIAESANRGETGEADEDRNLDPSLVEMLDDVIMLYHIAVHKQLSKVRTIFMHEKDRCNVHHFTSVGQRKKYKYPTGIEAMTFRTPVGCSSQETCGELGHILGSYMTCVLV